MTRHRGGGGGTHNDRWDREFFPEEDDSFAQQVKLLSRTAAQTKLDALLQLTKVVPPLPPSSLLPPFASSSP
jgi:hypothetical protein